MLDEIIESTRHRVADLASHRRDLELAALSAPPARGFGSNLSRDGLQVIAEIKRRSPSAGWLASELDVSLQAKRYETGGAAALSVLTEPAFFSGSLGDLGEAGSAVGIPVLRKDFIIDPLQILEARAAGADAVLLIVAALEKPLLDELLATAIEVGLDALVEAHTAAEVHVANECGATIIGVNNRDLATFATDIGTAEALAAEIAAPVKVAESGVSDAAAALRMAAAGYDAVLVGEALMRADDPAALIAALREAG